MVRIRIDIPIQRKTRPRPDPSCIHHLTLTPTRVYARLIPPQRYIHIFQIHAGGVEYVSAEEDEEEDKEGDDEDEHTAPDEDLEETDGTAVNESAIRIGIGEAYDPPEIERMSCW
ncbi:hypothetical protein CVT25_002576 [Psilocybe cyanescens]|uniref:Uncharacterized protein n=1 Tax=Psilocybe cyanescens TaxID=93625 RepID=A0A409WLL7_PSICY|nr:hypothetical protein CVT25_002576 [Psilocybe cyanescens]